jgi:ERCC4-type nuclease
MKIPAEPKPEDIAAIIDSREQTPWDLAPLRTIAGTLPTGDYSVAGLENVIALERKSLEDLLGCIGRERDRFERECQRLLAYPCRAIIVESTWNEIEMGQWRGSIKPPHVVGSLLGWQAAGIPIILAHNHKRAGEYASKLLYIAARRRWREARSLLVAATGMEGTP